MAGHLAEEDMKSSCIRVTASFAIGISLLLFISVCTSQDTLRLADAAERPMKRPQRENLPRPRIIKTTPADCEKQGGSNLDRHDALLVDCLVNLKVRAAGRPPTIQKQLIQRSVYDYFYKAGTEKQGYGLYSYVLFPGESSRAERFLDALFKTTDYALPSTIDEERLNIIYLPTRQDKLPSLTPMIRNGSDPPTGPFVTQLYDYALAQQLLAQICDAPTEVIRDLCATDLSRGPYLFTYAHPASALSSVPPPYLVVDLSPVHPRAFDEFIAAYKEQVKRSDYPAGERVDTLRLQVLSIVLTAADWIAPTKSAIADIIHLAKGEGGP
jgi:hypothetical protein